MKSLHTISHEPGLPACWDASSLKLNDCDQYKQMYYFRRPHDAVDAFQYIQKYYFRKQAFGILFSKKRYIS